MINGPDAIVYNTHWCSNIETGKPNSAVNCPKPPGHAVSIGGSQVDIYSRPIQSRTDVFVQKVGSEVFSSLTNERSQVLNVPYRDYKHTTHYGSPKTKNFTTSIPSHRAVKSDANIITRDTSKLARIKDGKLTSNSRFNVSEGRLHCYSYFFIYVLIFSDKMLKSLEYQTKQKQFDKHNHSNHSHDGIHNEGTDRKRFYIKVLIVFLSQVFLLNLVFYIFDYMPVLNQWIGQHIWSMYLLCLLNGYNAVILLKVPTIERFFPLNVIILSIFTIFHSSIVVNITYQNATVDDAISFIIVLLTSTVLFIITTKYSYDITVFFYQYFYVFIVPLIVLPILILIFTFVGFEILTSKLFMVFTFIHFQFFTIITAQTLQGGHDVEVEIEDYVLGSMQMFIVILCSSLSLSTLFERNFIEEYDLFKTIFLIFNIPLVYFSILVNETNLKIINRDQLQFNGEKTTIIKKTIILQNAMRKVNETVLQQHPFMYDY
ncbi:unnamed protein product [Schistosoma intercalatum]|nr:unnamed protein product [Schistosoma intercalatum]